MALRLQNALEATNGWIEGRLSVLIRRMNRLSVYLLVAIVRKRLRWSPACTRFYRFSA